MGHGHNAISIHAPREGSDWASTSGTGEWLENFYPRSPRGERQRYDETGHPYLVFLSTLPARGATSTHSHIVFWFPFLSTLPARGATIQEGLCQYNNHISIHAPREGSDRPFI